MDGAIKHFSKGKKYLLRMSIELTLIIFFGLYEFLFDNIKSSKLIVVALNAKAEGLNADLANAIFTILIASVIAISIKIVGILLITGLLIIPAAASRNLSSTPIQMAIISSVIGLVSVVLGLQTSMIWNSPTGPTILAIALGVFILTLIPLKKLLISKKKIELSN